jgi:hypothetical protein
MSDTLYGFTTFGKFTKKCDRIESAGCTKFVVRLKRPAPPDDSATSGESAGAPHFPALRLRIETGRGAVRQLDRGWKRIQVL